MSFRERNDRPLDWDEEEDIVPSGWPHRQRGASERSVDDLPPWSAEAWREDEEDVALPPARRSRTSRSATTRGREEERSSAPWPDLRGSLRGRGRAASEETRRSRDLAPSSRTRRSAAGSLEPRSIGRETAWEDDHELGLPDDDGALYPPVPRRRSAREAAARRRTARARPRTAPRIPVNLSALAVSQDGFLLATLGGSALSLLLMAAVISLRIDALPDWIVTHLNAAGTPDRWGTSSIVWRLPLMAAMLTIMNGIAATLVTRWDAFAARFLLGSSILIHALAWMALLGLLW
ncbi:MAG TPA: DUF1648 domain-containing protein [Thermomicrobiales bacterium]